MFSLQALRAIKSKNQKHLENVNALPVFTKLNEGTYEIQELIEVSDRGFTYKGVDTSNNHVQIKEFFPREALGLQEQLYFERDFENQCILLKDSNRLKKKQFNTLVEGFVEEARYLEKISYGDSAFRIVDVFEDKGTAYIVSNYNEWPSLQDFFDVEYPFTSAELDWVVLNMIRIVERFHRRGIVHRNITPKTIYVKSNEVIINSLGTNDFLQEIKIYDSNSYQKTYFAPEIVMHNGLIGTWTDVYALGKIIINMIEMTTPEQDYIKGLDTLPLERRIIYKDVLQSCIAFESESRIKDAMALKSILFKPESKSHTTSKMMVAAIALIAFVSSVMVLWQYETVTLLSDNEMIIEEEDIPMGPVDVNIKNEFYFITKSDAIFHMGKDANVEWFNTDKCLIDKITVEGIDNDVDVDMDLNQAAHKFNINIFMLDEGKYSLSIHYSIDGEPSEATLDFEMKK